MASAPDVMGPPDLVRVFGADGELQVRPEPNGSWSGPGAVVGLVAGPGGLAVRLTAEVAVARVLLRWHGPLPTGSRVLGDHWERSYGDLEWRAERPDRLLPWYFVADDGASATGIGVLTGPAAFCGWTTDAAGVSLWADVRCGAEPVLLGGRTLDVCTVTAVVGAPGESAFAVQQRLCRTLCPNPRVPAHPVFGANDWYVAYGRTSGDLVRRTTGQIVELSADAVGRPYSVVDDGWSRGGLGVGPWLGNDRFGDMGRIADGMRALGARPGIWYRPLTPLPDTPDAWRSPRGGCLDPSLPEVLEVVATQVRRMVGWGFELVKHDFSTFDLLGRWGFAMGGGLTDAGWRLADPSRTTAEVLLALYRTLRDAVGDAVLLGCNTVGHLAAGLVDLQRIGDDTSGVSFHRTRRMGVNALAFRAAQHGAFYAADPDIAAVTPSLPWPLARQWLDLVAHSGLPLFVSLDPQVQDAGVLADVRTALAAASRPRSVAEPLDWVDTTCPRRWRLDGRERTFDWIGPDGAWPFGD